MKIFWPSENKSQKQHSCKYIHKNTIFSGIHYTKLATYFITSLSSFVIIVKTLSKCFESTLLHIVTQYIHLYPLTGQQSQSHISMQYGRRRHYTYTFVCSGVLCISGTIQKRMCVKTHGMAHIPFLLSPCPCVSIHERYVPY